MIVFKPHQVFEHVSNYLPDQPVIVEAGAFTGSDSMRMIEHWPKATLYAFEPVPELFAKLKNNTKAFKQIHCFEYALSDKNGTATLFVSEKPTKPGVASQASSLHKPKERLKHSPLQFPRTMQVQTITLDTWAEKNKVKKIDFLWLDMQGHELAVLKAAPHILKSVTAIYTEVGFIEGYEGQPRYEKVKEWLEQQGFKEVGRDFEDQKQWFFGNALFVRKE